MKKLSLVVLTLLASCKSAGGSNSAPSSSIIVIPSTEAQRAAALTSSAGAKGAAGAKGPVTPVLSPAGGAFNYKPWVVLVGKKKSLILADSVKAKAPGAKDFSKIDFVHSCTQSPLAADPAVYNNLETFCVEVRDSGTLQVQADNGPVQSADFTINAHQAITLQTSGVPLVDRRFPTAMTEVNTVCQYQGTNRPRIIIEAADDLHLGVDKHVYFTFDLKSLDLGTKSYSGSNALDFTALVKSPKIALPWSEFGNQWTYSSAATSGKCDLTLDAYKVAGDIRGKVVCSDLAPHKLVKGETLAFGSALNFSGAFHCDEYVGINK